MGDLCTACMCSGRNLYYIGDTGYHHLYSQILNEIQIYDTSPLYIRVCWECRAVLRKWLQFTRRVKLSHNRLQYMLQNNFSDIAPEPPRLQICQVVTESFPLLTHIKAEHPQSPLSPSSHTLGDGESGDYDGGESGGYDCVKEEAMHCEPETFVNDLQFETKKKKDKKPPKIKEKTKKKDKAKPEKVPPKKKVKTRKKRLISLEEEQFDEREEVETEVVGEKEVKDVKDVTVKSVIDADIEQERIPESSRLTDSKCLPDKPQCAECGKHFSSKKTYRYHLNVLHKGQNRYPCPRCGKVYQWKSNLGRHLRSHKARDSGELYCALCDKRFASVATYRQHLRVSRRHVTETDFSFTCHECGKKFVSKTRLRDHIDWEHLNNIKFRCQLCNKAFKCHTSLYVHLQNVHRNKEKKDNLCHVCGKSYQNAAKLKYHIVAMHTGETPYRCQQCSAAFGWYSSLYRHVREVHYKMKMQPKKSKKIKKPEMPPLLVHKPEMVPSLLSQKSDMGPTLLGQQLSLPPLPIGNALGTIEPR
ncbi:zinc finger protein 2-like isoform X2 [Helicoverpa zea]|uniref:zinc finger protein 2-like isoform X1 n=1 Tax=Helicoverpa zea TaxID=7113 RepID=UPI001F57DD2F|nr:zinc finger protein 2-like isoform X1 [Helicoverpa zea]XP_047039696.1 zinc finger protein 2-like isoform X2 [Helicoverpa zea]